MGDISGIKGLSWEKVKPILIGIGVGIIIATAIGAILNGSLALHGSDKSVQLDIDHYNIMPIGSIALGGLVLIGLIGWGIYLKRKKTASSPTPESRPEPTAPQPAISILEQNLEKYRSLKEKKRFVTKEEVARLKDLDHGLGWDHLNQYVIYQMDESEIILTKFERGVHTDHRYPKNADLNEIRSMQRPLDEVRVEDILYPDAIKELERKKLEAMVEAQKRVDPKWQGVMRDLRELDNTTYHRAVSRLRVNECLVHRRGENIVITTIIERGQSGVDYCYNYKKEPLEASTPAYMKVLRELSSQEIDHLMMRKGT